MPLTFALIAHDQMKPALADWAADHEAALRPHRLICTGTTGGVIAERCPSLSITRVASGPLGGDQQIGAMIAEGRIDLLVFFVDPMTAQPHDVDVKALTRLATLYNIPFACNEATADMIVSSPLFAGGYTPRPVDFAGYEGRRV